MSAGQTEVRKLVRLLQRHGLEVRKSKSSHYKIYMNGIFIDTLPSSPKTRSHWRGNFIRRMRERGIHL